MYTKLSLKYGLILTACWIIIECLIDPLGNYPLNDDWAYYRAIKNYIQNGFIQLSDWQATSFVLQFIYGTFFVKLFGLSFTILKISTLSLTWILILTSYALFRSVQSPIVSCLLTSILSFNPIILNLSNTFMPDVPVLVYSVLATLFIFEYFKSPHNTYLLGITFFCILAVFVRQSALVIPVAFGMSHFLMNKSFNKNTFLTSWSPTFLTILAIYLFNFIMSKFSITPGNYNMQLHAIVEISKNNPLLLIQRIFYYFVTVSVSIGLLLVPILPLILGNRILQLFKRLETQLLLMFYFGLIIAKMYFSQNTFPFAGNLFYANGMGPLIMTGYDSNIISDTSLLSSILCVLFSLIGAISFFIILLGIIINVKSNQQSTAVNKSVIFCILVSCMYFLPIACNYFNDRYLIFLLPFILYATIPRQNINKNQLKVTFMITVFMIGVSTVITHDYFALHNTRWQALNYLVHTKKIPVTDIDGGFEFNALHHTSFKNYNPQHTGRWWFIENDDYIVSPYPRKGYHSIKYFTVQEWLPMTPNKMLILEKQN